jgi:hypothetical protein
MIANAAFLAGLVVFVAGMLTLEQLTFLAPYKHLILRDHIVAIAGFVAAVFLNLFALFYLAGRTLFLKDTGRKLAHVEKQLLTGDTIVRDLSDRLQREA